MEFYLLGGVALASGAIATLGVYWLLQLVARHGVSARRTNRRLVHQVERWLQERDR